MVTKNDEKNLLSTLKYFVFFKYPPNFEEIHQFYPQKVGRKDLQDKLNHLIKNNKISVKSSLKNAKRYTPRGYIRIASSYNTTASISAKKIKSLDNYLKLVEMLPQVKLVGLSGSVAMNSAKAKDDIDLFVVTAKHRLWTARLLTLAVASLLGRRRRRGDDHVNNKICLNLFFDESELSVPPKKRSLYVAHEVLQMKPKIDKQNTHARFLEANEWVFKLFPNARPKVKTKASKKEKNILLGDWIELLAKKLQLRLIDRHKTTEIITDKQLWFFPNDFEKKVPI